MAGTQEKERARERVGLGETVFVRGGACAGMRDRRREREYERLYSENQHLRDLPRKKNLTRIRVHLTFLGLILFKGVWSEVFFLGNTNTAI